MTDWLCASESGRIKTKWYERISYSSLQRSRRNISGKQNKRIHGKDCLPKERQGYGKEQYKNGTTKCEGAHEERVQHQEGSWALCQGAPLHA